MDPIRSKIAEIIRQAARKTIANLNPHSEPAKALREADVEAILKDDVQRVCEALSFMEITRAVALVSRLGGADPKKQESVKRELKMIAEKAAAKAEARGGKLRIPDSCRAFLFAL
jgi:hypothetical protein